MPSLCLAQRAAGDNAAEETVGEVMFAVALLLCALLSPIAAGAIAMPSSALALLSLCGILSETFGLVCALPAGVFALELFCRGGKIELRCWTGVPAVDCGVVPPVAVPVIERLMSGISRLFLRGFVGDVAPAASRLLSPSLEVNLLSALSLLLPPPFCCCC